jgi:Tol biopolymer transport system component
MIARATSLSSPGRLALIGLLALAVALLALPASSTEAAGPRANGKIAFSSSRDGNSEIYTMNADGSSQTRLTNTPAGEDQAAWSPDGQRIAFVSNRDGDLEIYVMNADGSGQTRLTNSPLPDSSPTWSPDGQRIAFETGRDFNFEIYTMNADGSGPTRLTTNPKIDAQPAWSPDGQRIAFVSERPTLEKLWMMNADGSNQTSLDATIVFSVNDRHPTWSPDGQRIGFGTDRDGNGEIYAMNADGSGQTRLTNDPAGDVHPAWSPDGRRIAFDSARDGPFEDIYVMNPDGSGQTRLTNDPARDAGPSWQSVPADRTPPVVEVPPRVTVNATGPAGAGAPFTVTATDDVDPAPVVSCAPASGSTFPIGDTTVNCSATDAAGNVSSQKSFTIHVKGAGEQIGDVIDKVIDRLRLPPTIADSLRTQLKTAAQAVLARDAGRACTGLRNFKLLVQFAAQARAISSADAAALIGDADRIRAVLAC